jgi:hypothetical protein
MVLPFLRYFCKLYTKEQELLIKKIGSKSVVFTSDQCGLSVRSGAVV